MRWLFVIFAMVFASLQFQLWWGSGGLFELFSVQKQVQHIQRENQKLAIRNRILQAEVEDLKEGFDSVEEIARSDLGLIREGEIFYFFVNE